jgi:hypothetical protein
VVRWSAGNAQLCPEKYSGEEHQNTQDTTDRRPPIRRLHRLAHSDQVSSQEIRPRSVAFERYFACELCNAGSNGLPGGPPHKVPELNALWTISMTRKSRCDTLVFAVQRTVKDLTDLLLVDFQRCCPKTAREYVSRILTIRCDLDRTIKSPNELRAKTCCVISRGPEHLLLIEVRGIAN